MRLLLHALFAFIAISICSRCYSNEPDKILHNKCLYPSIQVSPENKKSYGSGIIVRSIKISDSEYHNVFLTAGHVADTYETYQVKVFEYEEWSVLVRTHTYRCAFYAVSAERDLAVGVFISERPMPTADIEMDERLYIGTDVFRIGCGLGDEPRLDYGKVTSLRSKVGSARTGEPLLRTSVHTTPGDSGGALFNKYKVIGIARSIRAWSGHPVFSMSYYVPVQHLRSWSNSMEGAYHFAWTDRPLPKIPFWELRFQAAHEITRRPL